MDRSRLSEIDSRIKACLEMEDKLDYVDSLLKSRKVSQLEHHLLKQNILGHKSENALRSEINDYLEKASNLKNKIISQERRNSSIVLILILIFIVGLVGIFNPSGGIRFNSITGYATATFSSNTTTTSLQSSSLSSNITFSYAVNSGPNRLLIVKISSTLTNLADQTVANVNLVKYGTQTMTFFANETTSVLRAQVYYLVNPSVGTADLFVNFSGIPTGSFTHAEVIGAETYFNVSQVNPLANEATASGSSGKSQVSVTSTTRDLVSAIVSARQNNDITVGTGTGIYSATQLGDGGGGTIRSASSYKAGAASVTMNFTDADGSATDSEWLIIGFTIRQSGDPPNVTSITLNSTTGFNLTTDNLTTYYTVIDPDDDNITNITDWRLNGSSFALVHMEFEANGTLNGSDYSTYGNKISSIEGSPLWNKTGGFAGTGVYSFDGVNDILNITDTDSLDLVNNNNFTITFWINPASSTQKSNNNIFRKSTTANGYGFESSGANLAYYFFWQSAAGGTQCTVNTTTFGAGKWQFLAIRKGGATREVFLNGTKVATGSCTGTSSAIDASASNLQLGGWSVILGREFNGSIDDFRIYNRSLSNNQILQLALNKTNVMLSDELHAGDNWSACVTPNDGTSDGITLCSNNVVTNTCADSDGDKVNGSMGCGVFDCNDNNANILPPLNNSFLNRSITFCPGTFNLEAGVRINASNIVITCNNTFINGSRTSASFAGIRSSIFKNVTIQSCQISNYNISIQLNGSSNNLIVNNNGSNNVNHGIIVQDGSWNNTIINNTLYSQQRGVFIFNSSNNVVVNNTIYSAVDRGIILSVRSNNNSIIGNNVSNSTFAYSLFTSSENNTFFNNVAGNSTEGFHLDTSPGTNITNNYIANSSVIGITIFNSSNVFLFNNSIQSSTSKDIATADSPSNTTTLVVERGGNLLIFKNKLVNVTDIDNLFVNTSLVAVNATVEQVINKSANITLLVSSCPVTLLENRNFSTTIAGVRQLASVCTGNCLSIVCSNNVLTFNRLTWSTVFVNSRPNITSILLNSTKNNNLTTENLTVYFTSTDIDGDSITNITDWRLNRNSTAIKNIQFEPDGLNNITDYSTYNETGTVVGKIAFTIGIRSNKALMLNGSTNSYINYTASSRTNITGSQLTVMAWVNFSATLPFNAIAGTNSPKNQSTGYLLSENNSALFFDVQTSGGFVRVSANSATIGNWTHVAGVYNSTHIILYVNGIFVNQSTATGNLVSAPFSFIIGGYKPGDINSKFNGSIDDVRVYNYSLSADQINQIGALNRSDIIMSQELRGGDVWSVAITPNDGVENGATILSNNVTINSSVINLVQIYPNQTGDVQGITTEKNISLTRNYSLSTNLTFNVTATAPAGYSFLTFNWLVNGVLKFTETLSSVFTSMFSFLFSTTGAFNVTVNVNGSNPDVNNSFTFFLTTQSVAPTVVNVSLISTYGTNFTSENLTLRWASTDTNDDNLTNITDWRNYGISTAVLNVPFEANGTQNASDYSTYGNKGTAFGSPVWNKTGGYSGSSAYQFDGANDYIDVGTASNLDITGPITILAWVNPRITPLPGSVGAVVAKDFSIGNRGYMFGIVDTGSVYFEKGGVALLNTGTATTNNKWNLMGVTFNGTHWKTWLNGVNVASTTSTAILTTTTSVTIGRRNYVGVENYYNGTIDGVQIYNKTLSPEQILQIYNNRTDLIVSQELRQGQNWSACVTPNDGTSDGITLCSNNIVTRVNRPPVVNNVIVNSTFGTNFTTEDLTVYWNSSSSLDYSIVNITDWRINRTSIALLNIPFEADGADNTTDYSTNNLQGLAVQNGALWNKTGGIHGAAYECDGSDDIIAKSSVSGLPTGSQSFSMSLWAKPLRTNNGDLLFNLGSDGGTQAVHFLFRAGNEICFDYFGANNIACGGSRDLNNWMFLVGTYDGDKMRLYVNGTLTDQSGTVTLNVGTGQINLCRWVSQGIAFQGFVDDARIYNRTLTANEISSLYQTDSKITSSELKANEIWSACITPNDGTQNGSTICSNNVTIQNSTVKIIQVYPNQTGDFQNITAERNISLMRNYSTSTNLTFNATVRAQGYTVLTFNWFVNGVLSFVQTVSNAFTSMFSYLFNLAGAFNVTVTVNGSNPEVNDSFTFFLNSTNVIPLVNNVLVNSTSGLNATTDNLTVYWNSTDINGDNIFNITDWRINRNSIAVLNMPFEADGNQNATDYSTYGNNGSASSSPIWNKTGGHDGSGTYIFSPSGATGQYIDVGNASNLDITGPITILAWVNTKRFHSAQGAAAIVGKDTDTGNRGYVFGVTDVSGKIYFERSTGAIFGSGGDTMNIDQWYLIGVTFDGTSWKSWINGVNQETVVTTGILTTSTSLTIGRRNYPGSELYYNGTIDSVQIYNRGLSSEQILQIYNNRTDLIVSQELSSGQNWSACVTPNDGTVNGTTVCSNNVTISQTANQPPIAMNVILNSTTGRNFTDENLTVYWNSTSPAGNTIVNITDWRINGTSFAILNMPFEGSLNSTNNATDYSTFSGTGSVVGATSVNGYRGKAYNFTNTDHIISNIDGSKSFTWTAWFNMRTADTTFKSILTIGAPNYILMDVIDNRGGFWSVDGMADNNLGVGSLNANTWYYLAFVREGDSITGGYKAYLNGAFTGSADTGTYSPDANKIWIGERQDFSQPFPGMIDEVKVYNKSLSAQQIFALYNNRTDLIVAEETVKGQNWSACITPNDGTQDGNINCSNNVVIRNKAPSAPALLIPNNGNDTLTNITVYFQWNASIDADNDTITYDLNLTSQLCANQFFSNIAATNFTSPELNVVTTCGYYNWSVRANDGTDTNYSSIFNFTIQPLVSIVLTQNTTNFGNMQILQNNETSDGDPAAFIVQSNSNVKINVSVRALNQLWNNSGLGNNTFMFKINKTTTAGAPAFNFTMSQTTYVPIKNTSTYGVALMNYRSPNNTAAIDINVTVPDAEPAGQKSSTLLMEAMQS